jgi:Leucine-rich repeat (LRR) protein/predicted protein tyrosine phosphatase
MRLGARLETLNLTNNRVEVVPAALGMLASLRTLLLSGNGVQDLPAELGQLVRLEELALSRNRLRCVPACVYELRALRKLDLSANEIAGFAEPTDRITNLEALVTLNMGDNALAALPQQIGRLPRLEVLDASANQIASLPDFSGLGNLKALDLRSNRVASIPVSVFSCTQLVALDLGYNDIAEIPPGMAALTALKSCILFGNKLPQDSPQKITATVQANIADPDPPAEIAPGVWLGSYMSAHNRHGLRASGVTHILTVATLLKPLFPAEFTYHIVRIEDTDDADLSVFFEECIMFIEQAIGRGSGCLVHCAAGISRSASVCVAYLIAKKRMTAAAGLEAIKEKRPRVCPNLGFIAQLNRFEKKMNHRSGCKHQ